MRVLLKVASSEGISATVGIRGIAMGISDAGGHAMTSRLLASFG